MDFASASGDPRRLHPHLRRCGRRGGCAPPAPWLL